MSDDYWENVYECGEHKHWESDFPSPELTALVAANVFDIRAWVLDVGSGDGFEAIFLAQQGFRVTGIDISKAALKIAEKRAEEAQVKMD